jgi:hypothetical protein
MDTSIGAYVIALMGTFRGLYMFPFMGASLDISKATSGRAPFGSSKLLLWVHQWMFLYVSLKVYL